MWSGKGEGCKRYAHKFNAENFNFIRVSNCNVLAMFVTKMRRTASSIRVLFPFFRVRWINSFYTHRCLFSRSDCRGRIVGHRTRAGSARAQSRVADGPVCGAAESDRQQGRAAQHRYGQSEFWTFLYFQPYIVLPSQRMGFASFTLPSDRLLVIHDSHFAIQWKF